MEEKICSTCYYAYGNRIVTEEEHEKTNGACLRPFKPMEFPTKEEQVTKILNETTPAVCLWCGIKLDEPYIDPDSDGEIGYNWRKYCSTYCQNHNEYQ